MELYQHIYTFFAAASGLSLLVLFIGLVGLLFRRYFLPDLSRMPSLRDKLPRHSRLAR